MEQKISPLVKILNRLGRMKWLILLCAGLTATSFYLFSGFFKATYTSKSSIFPLNNSGQGYIGGGSGLGSILNGSIDPNFSSEASLNIIELASSKRTANAVAATILAEKGNKTVSQLLIESYNKNRLPWEPSIKIPTDYNALVNIGSGLVRGGLSAKTNKSGTLEIKYTDKDASIIGPINYVVVDVLSAFYRQLKVNKAERDYNFAKAKYDSVVRELQKVDRQAVQMSNTTLFTPEEKIQYKIPKENLATKKTILMALRNSALNNTEEALWRIQKLNPIIQILDEPTPPYEVNAPSRMIYAIMGFALGLFLSVLVALSDFLFSVVKKQVHKILHPELYKEEEETFTNTTDAETERVIYKHTQSAFTTQTVSGPVDPNKPAI